MTLNEIMDLINRSLFAEIGYTDEEGRQNIRKTFCVWHKGLGRHLISTNTSSAHVQSLMKNGNGCLYFADDSSFEGICLFGGFVAHFEKVLGVKSILCGFGLAEDNIHSPNENYKLEHFRRGIEVITHFYEHFCE